MSDPAQVTKAPKRLAHVVVLLTARLLELEERVTQGDESAWSPLCETAQTLAALEARLAPGERGELLTTKQMAERLGLAPKTLLRHVAAGAVRPAVRKGKLIRWKGDEAPR